MSVALIVGTDKGGVIARSDEAREQWTIGELGFPGWRVTAATRDPGGRTYVAVALESFGSAILASDDLEHWEQLESAPRYQSGERGNLDHNRTVTFNTVDYEESVSAANPQGLYAYRHVDQIWKLHCAGDVLYAGVSEAGLFRSEDRGKSWQSVTGLNDHESREAWIPGFGGLCLHAILSDAKNPDRLWVGISSAGVFRTEDGGETWSKANGGVPPGPDDAFCIHGLAHDPYDADRIFAQYHDGMFRSTNGAAHWERIETGLPVAQLSHGGESAFGFPMEVDPATGYAYAFPLAGDDFRYSPAGRLRVYRTTDGGERWLPCEAGMPDEPRYTSVLRGAMAVDRLDPCGVYVGTTSGQVFVSNDRGDRFQELPCTVPKILCVEAFAL